MATNNNESYQLTGSKTCERLLNEYPDYKVFWRSGFAFRGAGEREDDKTEKMEYVIGGKKITTFEERMERRYNWAAAMDIDVYHDKKEIHINGFSENDLY